MKTQRPLRDRVGCVIGRIIRHGQAPRARCGRSTTWRSGHTRRSWLKRFRGDIAIIHEALLRAFRSFGSSSSQRWPCPDHLLICQLQTSWPSPGGGKNAVDIASKKRPLTPCTIFDIAVMPVIVGLGVRMTSLFYPVVQKTTSILPATSCHGNTTAPSGHVHRRGNYRITPAHGERGFKHTPHLL